jgi:antitoxin HicB
MWSEHYTVVIEPDEEEPHRYNVHVPALPGCLTYGESIDDALANAIEAIRGYIAVVVADGEPVPVETHPTIAATIAVPLVAVPDAVDNAPVASQNQEIATIPRSPGLIPAPEFQMSHCLDLRSRGLRNVSAKHKLT